MIARTKAALKFLWVLALFVTGALWLAKRKVRLGGKFVVLTFHRVLADEEFDDSSSLRGIRVRARTLEGFAAWANRHFEVVGSDDIPDEKPLERLRMVVTFDDGWIDTYTRAYPIAAKCGLPLTVFVCSGLAGESGPFWPERVCRLVRAGVRGDEEKIIEELKRLPEEERCTRLASLGAAGPEEDSLDRLMTWEQIRELHNAGVTIGSHTVTHQILTGISTGEAYDELAGSRRHIEDELSSPCRLIAYPNGNVTPEIRGTAAAAGYRRGFTTMPGFWQAGSDPLLIPRVNIWEGKLIGPAGRFSRAMAEYSIFWQTPK